MKRSKFKLFVGFLWPENGTCVTCGKDSNQVIILNLFFRMKLENHSWHTQYWLDSQTDQAKRKNTFTTDCKQFYDTLNHTMCKIGYKPTRHWPRQIFITQCEVWRDIHHTRHSHGVVNVWWRSRYNLKTNIYRSSPTSPVLSPSMRLNVSFLNFLSTNYSSLR